MYSDAQSWKEPRRIRGLMTGIFAAPVAAAAHAQTNYALVPLACDRGWPLLLHLTPALAALVCLYGLATAWSYWSGSAEAQPAGEPTLQRGRFLAMFGVLFSAISLLLVIMSWIPVFLMDPCQ